MDMDQLFEKATKLFQSDNEEDNKQAFEIFKELADADYINACTHIGYMLMCGIGTEENFGEAFKYLKRAADDGNAVAMYYLGICHYDGLGTEENRSEAYFCFRSSENGKYDEATNIIKKLEFSADDKKMYEDIIKDIEVTDETVGDPEKTAKGSPSDKYIAAKYYAERSTLEYSDKLKDALYLARQAYHDGLDIARPLAVEICGKYAAKAMKTVIDKENEYEEDPVLIDGHEPNAVEVGVFGGGAKPIYIEDFSCYEGLGVPLGCERINIVSTKGVKKLSLISKESVVGYVDADGQAKELLNNSKMSTISGYNYLAGVCIICGFDGDYKPLPAKTAYALAKYLDDFDVYDDGRFFEAINAYM